MALEDILKALDEKADKQIQLIAIDSQKRVDEITTEISVEADRRKQGRIRKVTEAARSEATAILYSAQLRAKNEVIRAQEKSVGEAFRLAEERLGGLAGEKRYPKVLNALLEQALDFFDGGEVVIQTREKDRGAIEKAMTRIGTPFTISDLPLEAHGGVVVSSPDGRIVVSNTFESRLIRAQDRLRMEVSKVLFEAGS